MFKTNAFDNTFTHKVHFNAVVYLKMKENVMDYQGKRSSLEVK